MTWGPYLIANAEFTETPSRMGLWQLWMVRSAHEASTYAPSPIGCELRPANVMTCGSPHVVQEMDLPRATRPVQPEAPGFLKAFHPETKARGSGVRARDSCPGGAEFESHWGVSACWVPSATPRAGRDQ